MSAREHYEIIEELGDRAQKGEGLNFTYLSCRRLDFLAYKDNIDVPKFVLKTANNLQSSDKIRELFDREINILLFLNEARLHQNKEICIPKIDTYNKKDLWFAYQYVQGSTLEKELRQTSPLSEEKAIELLREMLELTLWIHDHNVIHRDIKPLNIIRSDIDNKLHLIDFGAATLFDPNSLRPGTVIGTSGYQDPIYVQSKIATFQTDIYSIGMIGIESILGNGIKFILGYRPNSIPYFNSVGKPVWPSEPKISEKLKNILTKMVEESQINYRYPNIRAVLEDLGFPVPDAHSVQNQDLNLNPDPTLASGSTQIPDRKPKSYLLIFSIVALIISSILYFHFKPTQTPEPNGENNSDLFSLNTYHSENYKFNVGYPRNWEKISCEKTEGCIVKFSGSKNQAELAILIEPHPNQGKTLAEFNNAVSKTIEAMHPKHTKRLPVDLSSFGEKGIPAIKTTYMFSDEMPIKQTIITAVYDFKGYIISFSAPHHIYTEYENLMNEMLNSFQFTQP